MNCPRVFFAIPAMDELEDLGATLACIAMQDYPGDIQVYVCVNQAEGSKEDPKRRALSARNLALWERLKENPWGIALHPIDRFSEGKAWKGKRKGVGMARRSCVEALLPQAADSDILIHMDADTLFSPSYVRRMVQAFRNPRTDAATPAYYHRLSGCTEQDRAILRYEIYLRCYLLQLLRIASPYAFTALGSAICCKVGSYRKVGGFDSQEAGEDFYFLQKIAKCGQVDIRPHATVYPSSRVSERVPFGTGPAIRSLLRNESARYPVFPPEAFDAIQETYLRIPELQKGAVSTPLTDFMDSALGKEEGWERLRRNYPTLPAFTKAFHQKADGLRLFQFLRRYAETHPATNETNFRKTLISLGMEESCPDKGFRFETAGIGELNALRDACKKREDAWRLLPALKK
ncbi:MAG: glycosyltransferase family 2 protein [Bacteroidales bacterium]|nr:glycosyltransferase family 2 protein [Bacteroidales bacterium]